MQNRLKRHGQVAAESAVAVNVVKHEASWLLRNGSPVYDLQEMGGWKSAAVVRRYAHLGPAQMARHAAVVDRLLRVTSTAQ
jgi:hypothetical protein